jgi:hypothetical protein
VRRVRGRAVPEQLGEDRDAARLGVLERLEDHDARALGDHEAVAVAVERPGRRFGVIVAGRERAHRREPADEPFVDAGLGAAGDHHVGVAAADDLRRLADAVPAGRTGGHGREVGPERPEVDRDLPRADVADAHRDEERAEPVRSAGPEHEDVVEDRLDAAEAGAQDHAGRLRLGALEPFGQAGHVHRLARGNEAELDVAIGPPHVLSVEHVGGVEVAHLARDLGRDAARVEPLDAANAGPTRDEVVPRLLDGEAERRHEPEARDHDAAAALDHRTTLPVRTVAAR